MLAPREPLARRDVVVVGIVQGVGFRPFIHRLATRLGLAGAVRNAGGVVEISIEGSPETLDAFMTAVRTEAPPLARIDGLSYEERRPSGCVDFQIIDSSASSEATVRIAADAATCPACLEELFDPEDRRYRYPFICCTACGPRFTITKAAPWDRSRTTMRSFAMCDACRAEYEDVRDRRFHAEPIACPACGPSLSLTNPRGGGLETGDPLAATASRLARGEIVAIKGLGGFHLACDATSDAAVKRLRSRKHREERPLAVMVADIEAAREIIPVSESEAGLLRSAARPIVLIRGTPRGISPAVSAGVSDLGLMLPYTPLHHLLLRDLAGLPIVLTSGNLSDEPIAYENEDAVTRLAGVADTLLIHDRPIETRCDDSVLRVVGSRTLPVRRSRGFAPEPWHRGATPSRPILALGGHLKATFALGRAGDVVVSHHYGDLDHLRALDAFESGVRHYEKLLEFHPEIIVHDLHPDYATSRYGEQRAARDQLERVVVQHHRAHVASCMAEHRLEGPVIGVAFDGAGLGDDGSIWGGEIFVGDYHHLKRAAHLRSVPLPGGVAAIREPWRMAVAHLRDAELPVEEIITPPDAGTLDTLLQMMDREVRSPPTSSVGRLFDAVAALVGLRMHTTYEGQAAAELEASAVRHGIDEPAYDFTIRGSNTDDVLVMDARPTILEIVQDLDAGAPPGYVARRFHATVARMIVDACVAICDSTDTGLPVVLSGGVFANAVLLDDAIRLLEGADFEVFVHEKVPPNDGGLCLGQLAIAVARST